MKNSYIGQAWLVLVLAVGFGAALAGVQVGLSPLIEANKLAAVVSNIPALVPGADLVRSGQARPLAIAVGEGAERSEYEAFRAFNAGGRQIGWAIKARGKGFADAIELVVGVDAEVKTITGLYILDQKETPGLGNKITEAGTRDKKGFLWPFGHWHPRADHPLVVTTASPKEGEHGAANKIKAVAGATISSKSVCDIINEALSAELRRKLAAAVER